MAFDLRIDPDRLKALPRRLKIVLAVIVLELLVILGTFVFENVLDDLGARVGRLRAQVMQTRRQSTELRHQIEIYPEMRQRYQAAIEKGIFADPNAVKVAADAQDLAGRHALINLRYKVEPQSAQSPGGEKIRFGSTLVTFDGGAVLDDEAMDFWDDVFRSQSSHYHVIEASLERAPEGTGNLLDDLHAGKAVPAVRVHLSFLWLSLRHGSQGEP